MKHNKEERAKKIRQWVKTILATIAIITAFISAIVFAPFLATLLRGYLLGAEDKYEFFRDILIINLAIMGIFFTAIVVWIHIFITDRVKDAVALPLEKRDDSYSHYAHGLTLLNTGYICWLSYKSTMKEALLDGAFRGKDFLDLAIDQTERAYNHAEMLTDVESRYKLLKCQTRNNLGYYLAERGYNKDKNMAIMCATYLKKQIKSQPYYHREKQEEWLDTCDHIMSNTWGISFPPNPSQKGQGH